MSGLFGFLSNAEIDYKNLQLLALAEEYRGQNSSGFIYLDAEAFQYTVFKNTRRVTETIKRFSNSKNRVLVGYSGLNFSSGNDVPPIINDRFVLFHSGIVLNTPIDVDNYSVSTRNNSSFISDFLLEKVVDGHSYEQAIEFLFEKIKGDFSCALIVPITGKLFLFTNCDNIFYSFSNADLAFSSEKESLSSLGFENIIQLKKQVSFDIPLSSDPVKIKIGSSGHSDSLNTLYEKSDLSVLQYKLHDLKRCSRCILPETMPHIKFDYDGVCNYCHNYKIRNTPKPKDELHKLVESYRRSGVDDCIVPFSGGRDSCFALHVIVNELKMKPITYTYDWGMVTDVGRRNISLMCGELGVQNIVVSADIEKKRKNISLNFGAWLKKPNLGMLNILTAGDKHFFRYVDKVKTQTGIDLNIWGVNPLEVTHFKTGFLGIEPDFEGSKVYSNGALKQLRYQSKRFSAMLKSPGYFNSSLWDTLSGEYHRSVTKKSDYFHLFDFWQWDENEINGVLDTYKWERASDTTTTWRIGDGTAGIYNYIYYTLAGFTEHDTFRSNQVREGQLTREQALRFVEVENAPCHDNLRWYLKSINFDFDTTIKRINSIPRLHEKLY